MAPSALLSREYVTAARSRTCLQPSMFSEGVAFSVEGGMDVQKYLIFSVVFIAVFTMLQLVSGLFLTLLYTPRIIVGESRYTAVSR
jgi:hypothetical protein